MAEMEPITVGVRTHDANPGLVTVSGALVNTYFRDTRLMGAAAQVITLLSGLQVVRYQPLVGAAGEIGVDDALLDKVLRELEEMDEIRFVQERSGNHRVEPKLKRFEDTYEVIGQRWRDNKPTHVEDAAVYVLDRLALCPMYESDVRETLDISDDDFEILRNVMQSCGVVDAYVSPANGRTILISPLYWEDNPQKFFELQDIHGAEDVTEAMERVRSYQGLPEDQVSDDVLRAAIDTGILPTVTVTSTSGPKRFLFTPRQGHKKVEKVLLTKAFAALSCLRYGQHHAGITRLTYSASYLLRALKDRKRIGPHSEAITQYSPLVELMMGRIEEGPSGRFTFHLYDTPENMKALALAIELASIGEPHLQTKAADAAAERLLLPPGSFQDEGRTRIDVKRSVKKTKKSAERVAAIISGVSSDIV